MSIVVCRLPKTGLGNQLFPLMKAFVMGYLNGFPVIVTGYHQFKIGPYLRKEKTKRNYNNYFVFQKGFLGEQKDRWKIFRNRNLQNNTEALLQCIEGTEPRLFEYKDVPHWDDFFNHLKDHRDLVVELLWGQITPNIKGRIDRQKKTCIGVHIRMGDFRKLREGEEFSKVGSVRTPETYFIDIINNIRTIHGSLLPVSVFTDGYRHEFEELFLLDNIEMVEGNADIVDMLLLSQSDIIVCSAGSTFSYWAGFLADAPIILHPDHIHQSLRPDKINDYFYEGAWDSKNTILINNIINIPRA